MKTLYESLLGADIEDKMQDSVADWVKDTVWSKSDVKNFTYKELQGHVKFPSGRDGKVVVDDFIRLNANDRQTYAEDATNNRHDKYFIYEIYCVRGDATNLRDVAGKWYIRNGKKTLFWNCDAPVAEKLSSHRTKRMLQFRVLFGEKPTDRDYISPYWPQKDGEWVVRSQKEEFFISRNLSAPVSTYKSAFDGHIPSKNLY